MKSAIINLVKYAVITFGCRVNQADSLGFEEGLRASGGVAAPPDTADVVVVNTCSVTASADQAARQAIRRLARENPHAKVVVTGCYASRHPDEVKAMPNVARVVVNDDKPNLIRLVRTELTTSERFGDGEGSCGAPLEPGIMGRTAFTLRVQTGCAEPCSYCIIPTTRGTPRSTPLDQVLAEISRVAAAGFKEIALTGVHLGSYGRDWPDRGSLVALLRRIDRHCDRICADLRFRISSLEPMDCTRDIVDFVATSDRFAEHFHLPLQHANRRVLAAMRRPYTNEQYAHLVDDIRARMPSASIGSDVIVGFPGETSEEFEELASYLDRSPLTHIHVFPYSDRPGTAASSMAGKISGSIVRERAQRLRAIAHTLSAAFRDSQVGTVHRGLTIEDGSLVVTGNYLKLRIAPGRTRNEWLNVAMISRDQGMAVASV